jgi:LPS sulfotransferase NodH
VGETWDQFGADYDHPPFDGVPRTYLIASTPRSGSHFLGHLLLGTGALGSPLEYLSPIHGRKWMDVLGVADLPSMMQALYRRRTSPSGWFGIKAHWWEFEPVVQDETLFSFLDIRTYIHIRRRDRIAQAISALIAHQTKSWISFHDRSGEPSYDFAAIRNAITQLEGQHRQWDAFFNGKGISPFVVEYEHLIDHPDDIVDGILAHMNVSRSAEMPTKWQPGRQASDINERWRERYLIDLERLSS